MPSLFPLTRPPEPILNPFAPLRSGANGFKIGSGGLVSGNNDGIADSDFHESFTVAASNAVVVSMPDFTRGPGQPVGTPATSSGIPINLNNGAGVTSVNLTLN